MPKAKNQHRRRRELLSRHPSDMCKYAELAKAASLATEATKSREGGGAA